MGDDEVERYSLNTETIEGALYSKDNEKALEEAVSDLPKCGLEFESEVEAKEFYNKYAGRVGFGIRTEKSNTNAKGIKYIVIYSCTNAGYKKGSDTVKKSRASTRCGCPAVMKIVLKDSGRWCVTKVRLEHNHSLTPGKARYFKSHKELHDGVKRRLELSAQTGRMTSQTFEEIAIEHGGKDQLSFGLKECSNYLSKVKAMELCEGDAEAMLKFFDKMLAKCQNVFYVLDLNSEGSLVNIFWADSRSREAYEYFCDVVTFDTTYLTNRYKFKFAPFVGVNHHGQSILLGCGLLANETIESFVWLFTKWLMAIRGCAPNAIITDQAEAIQAAIEEVFPKAKQCVVVLQIVINER